MTGETTTTDTQPTLETTAHPLPPYLDRQQTPEQKDIVDLTDRAIGNRDWVEAIGPNNEAIRIQRNYFGDTIVTVTEYLPNPDRTFDAYPPIKTTTFIVSSNGSFVASAKLNSVVKGRHGEAKKQISNAPVELDLLTLLRGLELAAPKGKEIGRVKRWVRKAMSSLNNGPTPIDPFYPFGPFDNPPSL